jgi:hypothetical protein
VVSANSKISVAVRKGISSKGLFLAKKPPSHLKLAREMKGIDFTGCGKYSNRVQFCIRARLQLCRRDNSITLGFAAAVFFQPFALPQRLKPTHFLELLWHD